MRAKTLVHGLSKSRKGKPSISFQTLVDRTKMSAFFGTIKAAAVDDMVALDAAKRLAESPRERTARTLETGALTATAAPAAAAVARGVKGAIDAKKGRWGAARAALRDTTKGGVASDAIRGGMAGMVIGSGRDTLETARAKRTVRKYLDQHKGS